MPQQIKLGDFLELDGLPCVVVGLSGERLSSQVVPEKHLAVWFGNDDMKRKSEGGAGGRRPEVWLVPQAHFEHAAQPDIKH